MPIPKRIENSLGQMNNSNFLMTIAIKHVPLIIGLLYLKPTTQTLINTMTAKGNAEVHRLVLTVSGLILAGAISGFTRFTYQNICRKKGEICLVHIAIGHITTILELIVIGILLLVSVACLKNFAITSELGNYPFIISCILYLSLVSYDIYDLMHLTETE
jgi:high-affinity K+ transport system ATPase subunit B